MFYGYWAYAVITVSVALANAALLIDTEVWNARINRTAPESGDQSWS